MERITFTAEMIDLKKKKITFYSGKNFLSKEKITSVTEIIFFGAGGIPHGVQKGILGIQSPDPVTKLRFFGVHWTDRGGKTIVFGS